MLNRVIQMWGRFSCAQICVHCLEVTKSESEGSIWHNSIILWFWDDKAYIGVSVVATVKCKKTENGSSPRQSSCPAMSVNTLVAQGWDKWCLEAKSRLNSFSCAQHGNSPSRFFLGMEHSDLTLFFPALHRGYVSSITLRAAMQLLLNRSLKTQEECH